MKQYLIAQTADTSPDPVVSAEVAASSAAETSATSALAWVQTIFDKLGPVGPYLLAIVILLIGRWVAKMVGKGVTKALGKTALDSKIARVGGFSSSGIKQGVGTFVYYLLLLFVVMLALDIAGMSDAVQPLREMFAKFLGYIPNLVAGGILLFLIIFLAKVVKGLLGNLLNAARVDERLGAKSGQTPVAAAVSNGVFFFIILLMLPQVLGAFRMTAITDPVVEMVRKITDGIPNVLIGLVLFAIGYLIADIVRKLVKSMLVAAGFDKLPAKLGYKGEVPEAPEKSPSGIVSYGVFVTILVTISIQALGLMQLGFISDLGQDFLGGYFQILGGLVVFGLAIFLANLAFGALSGQDQTLAKIAKYGILIFGGFIALNVSEIAPALTDLPYRVFIIAAGFALGVGGAIALGLGGRETVSKLLKQKVEPKIESKTE